MTDIDIRANRQKWIDFLKLETTKKARGQLVSKADPEARCCLGHACHVLGLEFNADSNEYEGALHYAPPKVVESLGLWNREGGPDHPNGFLSNNQITLAHWNDRMDKHQATQREIAEYLETVIEGGPNTPFQPI